MPRIAVVLLVLTAGIAELAGPRSSIAAERQASTLRPDARFVGRWDLTVHDQGRDWPSWLEADTSGRDALIGRFVGVFGSARPITRIEFSGDSLHFAIPHQWESGDGDLVVSGKLVGDTLTGSMTFPDGHAATWSGVRAPLMLPVRNPVWGTPINLLAHGTTGWHTQYGQPSQWVVENGVLRSPKPGDNLVTDRTFRDFKLHIEFRVQKDGNSGVYLRGRHEVQVEDDYGREPGSHRFSGVYGFIEPNAMMARPAGEWNTYDITLVGRAVTVVANGRRVICEQIIPGPTGGAIDSHEGEPGPLLLQGDHLPVEYRNIVITPAR
jgi:Domain of Unknown Function (DUF1080)